MMSDFNDDKPPVLGAKPAPAPAPRSPFYARLLNVIAMPGMVFEEVRISRHSVMNWLIPVPLYAISLALFSVILCSTPSAQKVFDDFRPKWRQAQVDKLAEQVKAGQIKQADADLVMKNIDQVMKPPTLRVLLMGAGFGFGLARLLWWTLLIQFLARAALRTPVAFGKALEVVALSSIVASLGNFAVSALIVDFGNSFSSGGFTLAVHDFNAANAQMLAALMLNVPNFWLIAVLGAGLARLTQQPWIRGTMLIAVYWIATDLLLMASGVGFAR